MQSACAASGPGDVVSGSWDEAGISGAVRLFEYDSWFIEFKDIYAGEVLGCTLGGGAVSTRRGDGVFDTAACFGRIGNTWMSPQVSLAPLRVVVPAKICMADTRIHRYARKYSKQSMLKGTVTPTR